jgi:hypothetical protein
VELIVKHGGRLRVAGQLAAGQSGEVILLAVHCGTDEELTVLPLRAHNHTIHRTCLVDAGQVVLLLMGRLHQDEEVIQPQQLADPLVEATAGQQTVFRVVDDKEFVDVVGEGEHLTAGLHDERWVTGLVVLFWSCLVSHLDGQVASQLIDPVDCPYIYSSRHSVDSQVVEGPVTVLRVEGAELWHARCCGSQQHPHHREQDHRPAVSL